MKYLAVNCADITTCEAPNTLQGHVVMWLHGVAVREPDEYDQVVLKITTPDILLEWALSVKFNVIWRGEYALKNAGRNFHITVA